MTEPDLVALSAAVESLSGPHWFEKILTLVPEGRTPWVWVAPDADDAPTMVGWGETARFTANGPGAVERAWCQFHTWAFDNGRPDALAFGSFPFSRDSSGFLVVPEVTITRRHLGAPTVVSGIAADALTAHCVEASAGGAGKIVDQVTLDQWRTQVDGTVAELRSASERTASIPDSSHDGALDKVVLARSVTLSQPNGFSQSATALNLSRRFPGCWLYAADGLVGATPELLVDCRDGLFRCRVLAGTRKPGWVHELFDDPKERHEHELAVASVTDRLAESGLGRPTVRGPFLLELPNVTHLATDITAVVGESNAARVVDAIHPTAAVCGTPREAAYRHIVRAESIDRGRYAGPVGWMDAHGGGQWALAIRGGQFSADGRSVVVCAGAGIMPSSDAGKEWDETEAKMAAFRSSLA